eukprot:CAMPEP_0198715764 /NCGR_PEP_ID=MMETSP1471-20131121/33402_1 /TAXON_ID=41880 /ORGANISM="Pycnococcus provasolii, Strain RCC733" /LENGTH=164 /DNA_ID=CAMNT_0044476229 /DNA_START=12 /DNA_END=502 /DNA_ORIENTATION=-
MENYKPLVSPRSNNTANQNAAVHMNHAMLDVTASPPVSKRMRSMETPDAKTAMEATTPTQQQQQQQSVKRKHISNATWTLPTTRSALETLVRAYVMDAGEAAGCAHEKTKKGTHEQRQHKRKGRRRQRSEESAAGNPRGTGRVGKRRRANMGGSKKEGRGSCLT